MNSEQLFKAIEQDCWLRECYADYLVRVRYKYKWETEWTYGNEYLEFDGNNFDWVWLKDWSEGQEDVEFLGFIAVDDIEIPGKERI